jgi:dipeptidase E
MTQNTNVKRILFAYGSSINKIFIDYAARLTGKANPKVCFIPTASGDMPQYINQFYSMCEKLDVQPHYLRTFVESGSSPESFEDILLSMDAIVVGGGNTLNMLAIWKAQGIDIVLKKAYDSGIVLSGGSAGSMCWFASGYTDSRPQKLTKIEGLGLIDASHSPHYHSSPGRRPLYFETILSGDQKPGYACDDLSGVIFENEKFVKSVSLYKDHHSYYVSVKDGKIDEQLLEPEMIY